MSSDGAGHRLHCASRLTAVRSVSSCCSILMEARSTFVTKCFGTPSARRTQPVNQSQMIREGSSSRFPLHDAHLSRPSQSSRELLILWSSGSAMSFDSITRESPPSLLLSHSIGCLDAGALKRGEVRLHMRPNVGLRPLEGPAIPAHRGTRKIEEKERVPMAHSHSYSHPH